MKVLLINDSTTDSNWGDRAAAISLKAMVAASDGQITRTVTEDDLAFSSFGTRFSYVEETRGGAREAVKLFIPPILLKARRRLFKNVDVTGANRLIPQRWEDFAKSAEAVLREHRYSWPDLLSAVENIDVAVIHGDGAMVGCGIVPRTDLFLAYLIKEHFDKPVVMVNHSADFDHPVLREMAENVYPLFDDVVFRDPMSVKKCEALCHGRFAADTAFWFKPAPKQAWTAIAHRPTYFDVWPDTAAFDPTAPYLCVGGSSLLCTAWRPAEITRDYIVLVEHIRSVYKGQIVVTVSGLSELEVFRPLATALGLPLISPTIPVQQAVDIVGNSDAYVGGRWHTAIFALRGGAPVVALSAKQSKMESLMLSADLPTTAFDALDVARHKEDIADMLLEHLRGGSELRSRLQRWADDMADNSWDHVAYLRRPSPDSKVHTGGEHR